MLTPVLVRPRTLELVDRNVSGGDTYRREQGDYEPDDRDRVFEITSRLWLMYREVPQRRPRIGRSVREVATALDELTTRGIHVRSLREGVDTSTPTGRAITSIMATIAELELELGKERRAASREARITRGLAATKPMKLDAAQQKRLLRRTNRASR